VDYDERAGVVSGSLLFGPAAASSNVDLPEITAYRVVFVDSCGQELAQAALPVPALNYTPGCCLRDVFTANIEAIQIPTGTAHLEIRLRTIYGDLPYGRQVVFKDNTGSTAVSFMRTSAAAAGGGPWAALRLWTMTLLLLWGVLPDGAAPFVVRCADSSTHIVCC